MTSTTTPPAGPPVPRLSDEVFASAGAVAPDRVLTLVGRRAGADRGGGAGGAAGAGAGRGRRGAADRHRRVGGRAGPADARRGGGALLGAGRRPGPELARHAAARRRRPRRVLGPRRSRVDALGDGRAVADAAPLDAAAAADGPRRRGGRAARRRAAGGAVGGGKSTTALAAAEYGLGFVADDYCAVDGRTVHSLCCGRQARSSPGEGCRFCPAGRRRTARRSWSREGSRDRRRWSRSCSRAWAARSAWSRPARPRR